MTFTVAFRAAIGIPLPSNVSSLLHPAVLFESLLSASRQASLVLAGFFPAVSLKPAAEVSLDFLSRISNTSYSTQQAVGCSFNGFSTRGIINSTLFGKC